MSAHPILRVLHRTLDVLDAHGVECAVMGGFAFRHWALPRPTYDFDFAVAMDAGELIRLLRAFDDAGFSVDRHFLSGHTDVLAGMQKVALGLFEERHVWRVDVFLANSPLVRSAWERRVPTEFEGRRMAVVSAEDLLLFKLLADRTKDRADVEDLLLVVGPLDEPYLRTWADRLGIRERLDRALAGRDAAG